MSREAQRTDELQILQTLCDERIPREQRMELLETQGQRVFSDPEHQVIFESIDRLIQDGVISARRLAIHLNNRGFPDIDIDSYFPAAI
jgi:hypothetical protein